MIEIKAPNDYSAYAGKPAIFLAGSIEMGAAVDWQAEIVKALSDTDVLILNPRREGWDFSWKQSISNDRFREQVEWELDALDEAGLMLLYFAPKTKSPISLLEYGLYAGRRPDQIVVCCPEGFWRKGNVDIVSKRLGVKNVDDLQGLIDAAKEYARKAV